jgi:hypothetical protein
MKEEVGKGRLLIFPVYFCSASKRKPASLAIKINPIYTLGSITKKRGVVIRSSSELDEISRLLGHPKVDELSKKIDAASSVYLANEI